MKAECFDFGCHVCANGMSKLKLQWAEQVYAALKR